MDQYIGKFLDDRYEILDVLGTGGMAVVYKAKCHRLNRMVAIKILKPELAQDEEIRNRFHDESQAVAKLNHPNIVNVFDVNQSDGVEYIVMELIEGITLKQYMQQAGEQPELAGGAALYDADPPGAAPCAQPWHYPSGHQTPEHHGPPGRQREGGRLRHRPHHRLPSAP